MKNVIYCPTAGGGDDVMLDVWQRRVNLFVSRLEVNEQRKVPGEGSQRSEL